VTLGYAWLHRGCSRLWGKPAAAIAASAFAVAWLAMGWFHQREFLRGPSEAAGVVARGGSSHVLYAGEADGQFIFEVRILDPKLQITVIPGGKVPPEEFQAGRFEDFCNKYGIDWVVVENVPAPHSWNAIEKNRPAFLRLQKSIPLESTRVRWRTGSMKIYKVLRGPEAPGGVLKLPVPKLGGSIDVKL
jgi:hypothetical protein